MPSRVVGTMISRTPRNQVAATKPARSVVAPPPRPTTPSERVNPAFPRIDQHRSATATLFASSPSGTSIRTGSSPASLNWCANCSAVRIMVGGCSSATRRTSGPSRAGTSASSPFPTSTSYGRSAVTPILAGSVLGNTRVHDHVDDLGSGVAIGVDDLGGHLTVERSSLIEQFQQLATDVAEEQRPRRIKADALNGLGQADLQPDHSMTTQCGPCSRGQYGPAAERQDTGQWQKFGSDLLFECSECGLAVIGEDLGDRLSASLHDDRVNVAENYAKALGKQ